MMRYGALVTKRSIIDFRRLAERPASLLAERNYCRSKNLVLVLLLSCACGFAQHTRIQSEIVRIDSPVPGLKLALHHEYPISESHLKQEKSIVVFVEGSAVPTAGNAAFKINGSSW